MKQSGAFVGLGDCLVNINETVFDEMFDAVFYRCLKAHSRDRMGLSD